MPSKRKSHSTPWGFKCQRYRHCATLNDEMLNCKKTAQSQPNLPAMGVGSVFKCFRFSISSLGLQR
eukprot:6192045-Amphidinium_carterae.1